MAHHLADEPHQEPEVPRPEVPAIIGGGSMIQRRSVSTVSRWRDRRTPGSRSSHATGVDDLGPVAARVPSYNTGSADSSEPAQGSDRRGLSAHAHRRGVAGGRAPDPRLASHVVTSISSARSRRSRHGPVISLAHQAGAHYIYAGARSPSAAMESSSHGKDGKCFRLARIPRGLRRAFSGYHKVAKTSTNEEQDMSPSTAAARPGVENRRAKTSRPTRNFEHERDSLAVARVRRGEQGCQAPRPPERRSPERRSRITSRHDSSSITRCWTRRGPQNVVLEQVTGGCSPRTHFPVRWHRFVDQRVLSLKQQINITVRRRTAIERRVPAAARRSPRPDVERFARTDDGEVAERLAAAQPQQPQPSRRSR